MREFIIIILSIVIPFQFNGQPESFIISNASDTRLNGIWRNSKTTPMENGCLCYEHESSQSVIYNTNIAVDPFDFVWVFNTPGICGSHPAGGLIVSQQTPQQECDIISVFSALGPAMIEEYIPIPTLSQWGLIILGLILTIFGYVALRHKSLAIG